MKLALLCTSFFAYIFLVSPLASYAATMPYWQILDNSQQPIKGAVIIVHDSKKTINKKLVSDTDGFVFKDIPSSIPAPWVLEVSSPNFVTKTVLNIQEKKKTVTIYLTRKEVEGKILTGKTSQFTNIRQDGLVDFGFTMLSVNLSEIWNITATNFFSTKIVPVPTFSKIKIPSNISLPDQTERYWISIRLKKDGYEINIPKKKTYIAHTLHGQFPLKEVIKKIKNGQSFISLVNLFKFKAYSFKEKSFTKKKNEEANFDLSKKIIDGSVKIKTNIDTNLQEVLLLSLLKKQNQYIPFDIKNLTSSNSVLTIPSADLNKNILGLLTEKNEPTLLQNLSSHQLEIDSFKPLQLNVNNIHSKEEEEFLDILLNKKRTSFIKIQSKFLTAKKISIALQKVVSDQVSLKFLPLIATPKINGNIVNFELPALQKDFKAYSSLLQLVEIKEVFIDKKKKHKTFVTKVLEEVGVSKWATDFNIDFIHNFKKDPNKHYALQIIFLATTNQSSEPSHATRNLQELL